MHVKSTLPIIALAASGASAARIVYGQIYPTLQDGTQVGCIGPNMTWTLGDNCATYQATRHFQGDEDPSWYTLSDLDGNHCGGSGEFQTCEGHGYAKWWHQWTKLKDGDVLGHSPATGVPEDCADSLFFNSHPKQTIFTRTKWIWKEMPAPAKRANNRPLVTKAVDACTATTTISATATTWTPTETPAPFTRRGHIHVLRDGKKDGCMYLTGYWDAPECNDVTDVDGDASGFTMAQESPCVWNPRMPNTLVCSGYEDHTPITFTGEGNKDINPMTNTTEWYAKKRPNPTAGVMAAIWGTEQTIKLELEWIWVYHGHEYPLDKTTARAARL